MTKEMPEAEASIMEAVYEEPEEETGLAKTVNSQLAKPELIDSDTIIANIKAEKEIRTALTEHLMEALVPKVDYYKVNPKSKHSLGKSGAEKICFMFNLVPKYVILAKTSNKNEVAYELRCDMYNKVTGKFAGSGVGSSSSREDKIVKQMESQYIKNVESVANNMLKIAKKRAYVDATLSSTMASFIFTQDLEDGYLGSNYKGNQTTDKNISGKIGSKTTYRPSTAPSRASGGKSGDTQRLDPTTFKLTFGKYSGKVLVDCETWYLQGQIDWIKQGKFDPTRSGYDKNEYIAMFEQAIEIRAQNKKAKSSSAEPPATEPEVNYGKIDDEPEYDDAEEARKIARRFAEEEDRAQGYIQGSLEK